MLQGLWVWFRRGPRSSGRWARLVGRSWARWTYAVHIEPTWLEVNHLHIPLAGLAAAFQDFRLVHLSDFHCGRRVPRSYLREAVELALAQKGDAIVLTGDYVHKGYRHIEDIAELLGRLQAPAGVYAVLGNHDYSVRTALGIPRFRRLSRAVAAALTARGIRVLHNEAVVLQRSQGQLGLAGVADLWSRDCDLERALAGLPAEMPRILLAHNPRTIEHLGPQQRCDLMLCGHTHGGQINLPRLGPIALGRRTRRFAAGLYRQGNTYLYVHKGIGFSLRLRYGVRPEIAVIHLHAAPAEVGQCAAGKTTFL
jgi:predicted MPP superfamily phosphohydrolase